MSTRESLPSPAIKVPVSELSPEQTVLRRVGGPDVSLPLADDAPPGVRDAGDRSSMIPSPETTLTKQVADMVSPTPAGGRRASMPRVPSSRSVSPLASRRRSAISREAARTENAFRPAVLTSSFQWTFVTGSGLHSSQDRPAMRHEVQALTRRFEAAMSHCTKVTERATASPNANLNTGDSVLDQDFQSCKSLSRRVFMERVLPAGAEYVLPRGMTPDAPEIVSISQPGIAVRMGPGGHMRASTGDATTIAVTPEKLLRILDTPLFQDSITELGLALFEHKWADLSLGEAEDQIAVTSYEHGLLLHAVRAGFAQTVQKMTSTILRLSLGLTQAEATIESMASEVSGARRAREAVEKDIRLEYEEVTAKLEAETRHAKESAAAEVAHAHEQVEKLTESLKTLNAVFKKIRGEDDILKVADLKEVAARLERKLAERSRELESLQPIKVQLLRTEMELEEALRSNTRLHAEVLELRREVGKQGAVMRGVVQQATDTATAAATAAARSVAGSGTALAHPGTGSAPVSVTVQGPDTRMGASGEVVVDKLRSAALMASAAMIPGMDFMCARCNASLMAAANRSHMDVGTARHLLMQLAGREERTYTPCVGYRMLLPALPPVPPDLVDAILKAVATVDAAKYPPTAATAASERARAASTGADSTVDPPGSHLDALEVAFPKRPIAWVRWCMRAIILSKMREDSVARSARMDAFGVPLRRVRFPEFVFAWFDVPESTRRATQHMSPWMGASGHATFKPSAMTATGLKPTPGPVAAASGAKTSSQHYSSTAFNSAGSARMEWNLSPSDHARWAFYFGVRQLARDDAEGKLFYALLDERNGEDEETFFMHALQAMDAALPIPIKYGPTWAASDFGDVPPQLADEEFVLRIKHKTAMAKTAPVTPGHASSVGVPLTGATLSNSSLSTSSVIGAALAAEAPPEVKGFFASRRTSLTGIVPEIAPHPTSGPGATALPLLMELPADSLWIPLSYALFTGTRILQHAPADERDAILARIRARSVSSEGRLSADAILLQAAPSSFKHLKGIGGEAQLAAELYGTPFQPRMVAATADLLRRKRRGLDDSDTRCIDLFVWLRVLVLDYREEQARRRATIRVMFNVALANVATASTPHSSSYSGTPMAGAGSGGSSGGTNALRSPRGAQGTGKPFLSPLITRPKSGLDGMRAAPLSTRNASSPGSIRPGTGHSTSDPFALRVAGVTFKQFMVIVQMVAPEYPHPAAAALYREAYVLGSGTVDYDSFMAAAESRQLFSLCLRLPPIMGTDRHNTFTVEQGTTLAYSIIQRVSCLDHDLQPWVEQLPPKWAAAVASARMAVQLEINDAMSPGYAFLAPQPAPNNGAAAADTSDGYGGAKSPAPTAPLAAKTPIHHVIGVVGSVNLLPDGRRMLSAYRQLLDLLWHVRITNRAVRGEAGGPHAMRAITAELDSMEEILRADAPALAPDVLTLRRMARSGIPLSVKTLLSRAPTGLSLHRAQGGRTVGGGVARREDGKRKVDEATETLAGDAVYLQALSSIPLEPPTRLDEGVSPEEMCIRLGIDTHAWDPIVRLRSHEALDALKQAARTANAVKLQRSFKKLIVAVKLRDAAGM